MKELLFHGVLQLIHQKILIGTMQGIYLYDEGWALKEMQDTQIWDIKINSLEEGYACGYDNSTKDY
jgi:hypothetical protein